MANMQTFTNFLNSGMHNRPCPKIVHSVIFLRIGGGEEIIFEVRNQGKNHSEVNALARLRAELLQRLLSLRPLFFTTIAIRWYINFSPCSQCSEKIRDFVQEVTSAFRASVTIDMRFPFLYKIRRPSCEAKHCSHHLSVSPSEHRKNVEGLRRLVDSWGVTLRTFGRKDWGRLANHLRMSFPYAGSGREAEDVEVGRDFRTLMSPWGAAIADSRNICQGLEHLVRQLMATSLARRLRCADVPVTLC